MTISYRPFYYSMSTFVWGLAVVVQVARHGATTELITSRTKGGIHAPAVNWLTILSNHGLQQPSASMHHAELQPTDQALFGKVTVGFMKPGPWVLCGG